MASGMQAGSSELRISDLQGAVQKESPDVYVTFRLGNEHAETPVCTGAMRGLGSVVQAHYSQHHAEAAAPHNANLGP